MMKYTRPILVNRHKSAFDVYIGRGTLWGNPFEIDLGKGWTRQIVIYMYREHLLESILNGTITVQDFLDLSGKTIACSCSPLSCHGDIILEIYDEIILELQNINETD